MFSIAMSSTEESGWTSQVGSAICHAITTRIERTTVKQFSQEVEQSVSLLFSQDCWVLRVPQHKQVNTQPVVKML